MGYTTEFIGQFDCTPALPAQLVKDINDYADTRHFKRNCDETKYGLEGEMYIDRDKRDIMGASTPGTERQWDTSSDPEVKSYNEPAGNCPGLWCQWVATEDGRHIEWDENEKFYHYIDWLKWIVEKFLKPNGISLSGEVRWQGEDEDDKGRIKVVDNEITLGAMNCW